MPDYEIRRYRPDDRDAFLSLYEDVMGTEKDVTWFDWKYEDNPYVDHVPMFVSVLDGDIVGARSFFALDMRCDGSDFTCLQPCDTMVLPEHQRQGLFTRMTERAIDFYSFDYPMMFNFPNHRSLPGNLKLGWDIVSDRSSYYRVQSPRQLAKQKSSNPIVRSGGIVATPGFALFNRMKGMFTTDDEDVSVRREDPVPAGELAALYRQRVPDQIHAVRDETFYEWRYANPDWRYTTYLAEIDDKPITAIVTGTSTGDALTTTKLTDVVPLVDSPEHGVNAILTRIISDHEDSDLIVAPPQGIPASSVNSFGFLPDSHIPLSMLATPTTHVVRSFNDRFSEAELTDSTNWLMTFAEEDTS